MATLTENRKAILREMGQGMAIREFSGFGTRMRPHASLVDPPHREPGSTEIVYGQKYQKEIKYSDFKALLFDLGYIEKYYTDWSQNFYRLNQAGKAALQELDKPKTKKRG
jgi:hypothetical protein